MNNQPRKIILKPDDLQKLKCKTPECGSTFFTQIFELGFISKIISPIGQDQVIQLPKMVCIKCGSPPDLKDPNDMKKDNIVKDVSNNIN